MQLAFEIIKEVGVGNYPDLIHFANTQAQIFSLQGEELYGKPSNKIDYGEWENVAFQEESEASPDIDISNFEVKVLPGWGIIGGYKTGNFHKMIIYEFAWEMGQYLNSGSIKYSNDPVSSFTLSLENPNEKNPEHPGNVAVSEESSLLSPGAKLVFKFSVGDSEEYELGTFYVDRSNFTLTSETASVDGRNLIGKALKEQTLDEYNEYWYDTITSTITQILTNANLVSEQFLVENTAQKNWFAFGPTTTPFKAIEDIRNLMIDWKIEEQTDEVIVIGSPSFNGFTSRGTYSFYRNKDIFSRQITRDDAEVFNRLCVHTENFGIAAYRNIDVYEGWNLQGKKTYYLQVANGTRTTQVEEYADQLATQLGNVGKIESFTGPFRPHLMVGDEAVIISENGNKSLGLITEITHNFGKSGFYTNFTVDSGGKLGRGKLSEFIKKISSGSTGGATNIGYDKINDEEYRNIALDAEIIVSSVYNDDQKRIKYLNDGNLAIGQWYSKHRDDKQPYIIISFGKAALINKLVTYTWWEAPFGSTNRDGFIIEYWNGSFWVDLVEIPYEYSERWVVESTFDTVETSKIRYRPIDLLRPFMELYEIEVWGTV